VRAGTRCVVLAVAAVAASGCSSLCLTDACRAAFAPARPAPAAPAAITPEPPARTSDDLPVASSYQELAQLFRQANAALAEAKAKVDEIDARQKALMDELEREAAWRSCDTPGRPKCGLIAVTMGTPEFVAEFSASECKEPFGKTRKKLSRACSEKYTALFVGALGERYQLADATAVNRECSETPGCKGMLPFEMLCLKSHNDELLRRFNALNEPLQQERDRRNQAYTQLLRATVERNERLREAFEKAQEQREQRARDLEQVRAAQLEQEQQEREAARKREAMIRTFQAVSASMAAAAQQPYTPAGTVYAPSECTSDYACGSGRRCVKPAGQFNGVCARAVNEYGVQSFAPPDLGSIGPGKRQCWTMAECPVGFRCESGQCVR
jgi:hypothetical protein